MAGGINWGKQDLMTSLKQARIIKRPKNLGKWEENKNLNFLENFEFYKNSMKFNFSSLFALKIQ